MSSLPQVEALQFDFLDRDSNAFPETVGGVRESHGTSVAGEVAMEKGNDVCGVGVAYNSFITGLCVYYTHQVPCQEKTAQNVGLAMSNLPISTCRWIQMHDYGTTIATMMYSWHYSCMCGQLVSDCVWFQII